MRSQCLHKLGNVLVHFLHITISNDLPNLAFGLIHVDDGHTLLSEGNKALSDHIDIVIVPAGRFGPLQQARGHGILGTVQEKDELNVGLGRHLGLPHGNIALAPGEAINQELGHRLVLGHNVLHGLLQQSDSDFRRYDLTGGNLGIDQFGEL